jgi:hypothetical protein
MSSADRSSWGVFRGATVLAAVAMSALGGASASAQENVTGPPPPLQWPAPASASTTGLLPFQLGAAGTGGLRQAVEEAADFVLCKMLMKDAGMAVPDDPAFKYASCPDSIKAKVDAGQGKVAWADGARPTKCGRGCLGPPFMSQTLHVDRPNARYAMVYGGLTFHADTEGPLSRDVYYGLEVDVSCDVPAGSRVGTAHVTTRVDGPTADDPGFLESLVNFLVLPLELSQRITDGINSGYGVSTGAGPVQGPCSSIGSRASPPADFAFDAFLWDVPKPPRQPTLPDLTAFKPTATIYVDRIIRNHTIESNPSTAPLTFTLYLNGMPAHVPRSGTISLAPNGARHEQKYCRTIPMEGVDALQILFVDSLGGAVWSQFTPGQGFGSGGAHKMTTGRTYLTPGLHPGDKPLNFFLREFEVDYRIDYQAGPQAVTRTAPGSGRPGASRDGGRVPPGRPPPDSSCIRI